MSLSNLGLPQNICGTVTANNDTAVPVANANLNGKSVVLLTLRSAGGGANDGQAYVSSVTPGTGFSIKSGVADVSVYNYCILNIAL